MMSVAISRINDNVIHVDGTVDPIRDIEVRPSIPRPSVYFRHVRSYPDRPFISKPLRFSVAIVKRCRVSVVTAKRCMISVLAADI